MRGVYMEKIGLVLEGGGVRGAYTAGALAWLQDNNIHFDYSVGISSGAVYLSCYLMGQKKAAYMMSTHYAAEPDLVGVQALLRCGYYVDYKRIFKEDLYEKEGLTCQPLMDEKPDMEVGAYVMQEGKTMFFSPKDMDAELKLLNATCALPVASEVVEYKGMKMLDGGITTMIPIERAIEKKCTKFMVITTKPKGYVRKPASSFIIFMMRRLYKDCPQIVKDYKVRHLNYNRQVAIINSLVEEGRAVHILPSKTIKVSRFKGDPDACEALYRLGYQDMEERKEEILRFLKVSE